MGNVTRITTETVTVRMPYHFICSCCGKRNDQTVDISGSASQARSSSFQHASGTLGVDARKDLLESIDLTNEMIREYREGLRTGQKQGGILFPFCGTVCCYCGKEQPWSRTTDSGSGNPKIGKGCLIPVAGLILAVALFIAAASMSGTTAADVVGCLGFAVLLAGVILYFVYTRRGRKRNRADAAPVPDDPDRLPVLDPQNLDSPAPLPAGEKLDVPAGITLIRDSSFVYNAVKPVFRLNTRDVGSLSNGESLTAKTGRKHNVLYASDPGYGNTFRPLVFETDPGADAEIHFKGTGFVPDACKGIRVIRPE